MRDNKIDDALSVATPEGVRLQAVLADPMQRGRALLLDLLFIALILFLLYWGLSYLSPLLALGLGKVLAFVLLWGYFFLLEWRFNGVTPGKKLCRLQVVSADLTQVTLMQCAWRNVLRYLDFLPGCYGLGLVMMLMSPRNQRLGDWMAGTVVIYHSASKRKSVVPAVGETEPPPWRLSTQERRMLIAFAVYADSHQLERTVELSAPLAEYLPDETPAERVARMRRWGRWLYYGYGVREDA